MNRKGDKVQPTPKPNVVGGTMTSKNPTTTKCHPKTLDIPVTTSASIMSSAKKMIFANGNGDKRSSVGNALASHNRTTSSQSPRRGGRGGQQNKQQNQNQNQAHQQQTQKISPVSANSASSSSATSSSSSSGSSSGAINPSQLASICREVALIRDEHVAIRNTLSEKDGELGKTRVALRNLAEERDLLRNKVSELEQILKHSPQMYSHVASMISNGSGAVRNQNHPMIMSTMVASSSTSSPIPQGRHPGCGNNMNNNNNNNHSSIERQSSTSTSTSAAVIIPNNNHIPPELGNCVRNNKGNNGAPPPQQQQQNQKSGSVSGNNNGGLVVHPSKCDGGGMEDMVGNPVTLSSPPPPNINSQEAHQANNNSKKVGEREQQQHSMQQQQQGYVKNSSSSHHHPPPYQYEQPGKMGQVALSSPPFQQQDLLENGNGHNNENGNGMLPATIMTGCNNNNNQFKNVGTYGGGGGGVGGVGENLRHHHHQQHHHLSQSGITGLDLMLLGPDCSTKVVEHLVHPWAIESSVREIEHRLVLKGVPLDGERVREVEIEIDRLNSRIDHLRSQNDVLTLNLEDAKSHADRLTVLLGKYESNNVALQLALRYSWEHVLDRVDPLDLKSCSESCLLFERILSRSRNGWKFGEVFPLIFNHLYDGTTERGCGCCRTRAEGWGAMFNCRLVCRPWCRFVDYHLESNPNPEVYAGGRYPTVYDFFDGGTIAKFVEHFGNHRKNPLIGRNVIINQFNIPKGGENGEGDDGRAAVNETYTLELFSFVTKFGSQVWTMDYEESRSSRHLEYCKTVQSILHHFPNLRTLNLNCVYRGFGETRKLEVVEGLEEYLDGNPFPEHSHLQRLSLNRMCSKMGNYLLDKYAAQLKYLKFGDAASFLEKNMRELTLLEELEIQRVDVNDPLEILKTLQSPMEKLRVSICSEMLIGGLWPIDKFLRNVNHLPLNHLTITTQGPYIGEASPISPNLKNDTVTYVGIVCDTGNISFNFLSCLTNLKEVELVCTFYDDDPSDHPKGFEETVKIRCYLWENALYNSNVWEVVPSLEKISFLHFRQYGLRWDVWNYYYRSVYEDRKKQQGSVENEEEGSGEKAKAST